MSSTVNPQTVVGICNLCKGKVITASERWEGGFPPSAYCQRCGARPMGAPGLMTIVMQPSPYQSKPIPPMFDRILDNAAL